MADRHVDRDIAVIGMACRVGGANSPSELWDVLANSEDIQREITRFNMKGFYHPDGGSRKGLTNVKRAYMMDDNTIDCFDNGFFYTTPVEAIAMDPQQRMLLEVAYEVVESAGIPLDAFVGTDTSVFAGMEGTDYHTVLARDLDCTPRYLATGTATCMAANRISYFFSLSGPSLVVDTACSSSMAALHQAVRALQNGDSGMALVCGAKLILNPDMFVPSSELGFLSPDGKCKSFDISGDGYGRGEGVLALLLKPLKQAIGDNDPIRAVIKGTRLNQDGRTQGITLPSAEAQKQNMRSLYEELRISPDQIQYVEAHGTGTSAGDPLEMSAINSVFGHFRKEDKLVVGSVKANIGHLESSSALAAIVKSIECLERGKIPGQMHFVNPNTDIDLTNIEIPTSLIEWPRPRDGVRRAGVNTFGAGGTNGHAVLEAYRQAPSLSAVKGEPFLFKVSAADETSLRRLSLKYADYVEQHEPNLRDLGYTLLARRSTLKRSAFFVAQSRREAVDKLRAESYQIHRRGAEGVKKVIFVFTGQGAQWAQMGKDLIDRVPIFKATLFECQVSLSELPDGPSWSIIEELSKTKELTRIYQAEYAQPLCTALQLGLVMMLKTFVLEPVAVVGHSSGEICAAFAAGIITLRDAIVIAYYRGLFSMKAASTQPSGKPHGSMCALGLSEKDARTVLNTFGDRVQLAAVNSPTNCTLSGDEDAIREIVIICAENGTFCRKLRVDTAYHSHHMLPVACLYEKALVNAQVSARFPQSSCDMFSSVTSQEISPKDITAAYFKQNLTSTVQFASALTGCLHKHHEINTILEIGPHPALKGPSQEIVRNLGKSQIEYFHTCFRERSCLETLLLNAGAMIAYGMPLVSANVNAHQIVHGLNVEFEYGSVLTDLPSYQWDHSTSFWSESRVSGNVRHRQFPRHQLLGSRYVDDIPLRPCWRNHLMLKEVPWLMELEAGGIKDIPAAVYILMALEAARQLRSSAETDGLSLRLSNVVFYERLPLNLFTTPDASLEVQLVSRKMDDTQNYQYDIFSQTPETPCGWTKHCSGMLGWQFNSDYMPYPAIWEAGYDSTLSDKPLALHNHFTLTQNAVRMSPQGTSGIFEGLVDDYENYSISPLVLDCILRLPPNPMEKQNLPAEYKLVSIDSISIPAGARSTNSGGFAIKTEPKYPYGVKGNIEVRQGDLRMCFSGAEYKADHLSTIEPARRSLFFKPKLLADISKMETMGTMSLSDCMKLLTHKWPMSNIRVTGVSEAAVRNILESVQVTQSGEWMHFQSLQILGKPVKLSCVCDRVQYVERFNPESKAHMIFTSCKSSAEEIPAQLRLGGLACISGVNAMKNEVLSESFEMLSRVTGLDHEECTLWRMKSNRPPAYTDRKTVLFYSLETDKALMQDLLLPECVPLQPVATESFCKRNDVGRYDAIVLDSIDKSVIATWPGQELLPWLQTLIASADSILWVTQQNACNPFNDLAGSLLRTLQSERPSLKVTWLVFQNIEKQSTQSMQEHLLRVFDSMLKGENEIKIEVDDLQAKILRYIPDNELSSATGLMPPRWVNSQLGEQDYMLSLAAPREPVVLSSYPDLFWETDEGYCQVTVEASVVSLDDFLAFCGTSKTSKGNCSLGMFFAGRRGADRDSTVLPQVVGWYHGPNRKQLAIPIKNLYTYQMCDPAIAAAEFAALATASCITEGVARIREHDTFSLNVDGILRKALAELCAQRGAKVLDTSADLVADFTVCLDSSRGLLVNGKPVDVAKYLGSERGRDAVTQAWRSHSPFNSPLHTFDLPDYRQAYEIAKSQPYSTVITHTQIDKIEKHVSFYQDLNTLFSSNGAYVLIGGLGGLGRFVCSWMVNHGAKVLISISRSGVNSPEAQAAYDTVNASSASLQVIEADATDRQAMTSIFHRIRQQTPIKGIVNMAMILGDAPMASMTGSEWDRALRVKIDSSWILHEETLCDNLDYFIMFSSIASVLGNRNQGNYNVGNTFLNALASYRHSMRLPAVSIALGAMTDIGVLHSLNNPALLPTLTRSGLTHLDSSHLASILLAAVLESRRFERSLIVTGLEMFERLDGKIAGRADPLYWTEVPEFGHLSTYRLSNISKGSEKERSLKEKIEAAQGAERKKEAVRTAFTTFLSTLLGFPASMFVDSSPLAQYGLDSLSAVSCQYWFHRELGVSVSAGDILGKGSIEVLAGMVVGGCGG